MLQNPRWVSPKKEEILMIIQSVFILDQVGILFPIFWNIVGLILVLSVSFSLVISLLAVLIYIIIEKEKKSVLRILVAVIFITFIILGWFVLFSSIEYQLSVLIGSFLGFALIINVVPQEIFKTKD